MAKDRFNLEEEIMNAWQTATDLNAISEALLEDHEMDVDKAANAIIGLAELHEIRCKKLWACFEELLESGKLQN